MDRALIIYATGRTRHVYLHQATDSDGGRWATTGKTNSNTGWTLAGDGRVYREQYNARTNERMHSAQLRGATWKALEEAPAA